MNSMPVTDMIGIVGVGLVLTGYYKINTHKLTAKDMAYQLFNFIGSFLITISLLFTWNTASVVIEVAWMGISLLGMWRIFKSREIKNIS